jgi:hypothetical protein
MKKTLLMTCTFLALTAGLALAGAGSLNLGWNDCGGLPASLNRTFACNTNAGLINTLVGSFVAPSFVNAMSANEMVVDIQSAGVALPAWWGMRATGTCRSNTSLLINLDFTGGPFSCFDYWAGGASGGISEDVPVGNRARIKLLAALPAGSPGITSIPEGTEVYSFKMNVNNAKSAGLGACAGCSEGVCLVLNSIKINQAGGIGDKFVSTPGTRNYATWQGGGVVDCYAATPAKNTTWGSVKALYR